MKGSTRNLPMHDRRDDVQGLRAVAVALVVAYHLWPEYVPGGYVGVDVFFVISGFLITRNLLTAPPRHRSDVVAFWGRRIRRLLPAAFLVLGSTLFASRYLAPETDWIRTAHEAIASALYVENWMLVQQATDYLAPVDSPTPVQHYWSLAVEEQFYLVWPLLLVAVTVLAGRRIAVRSMARVVIALVLIASLAYSVYQTAADPSAAYFMTTTRIWELAAGALLATWIPSVRMPLVRTAGAWGGLAMIGLAALTFTTATPWPGSNAVLPIAGAVLFIWSACGERFSPGVLLGTRRVQWLGDASYSVYLWHWPLLVLAPLALNRDLLLVDKIGIVALTWGLSWFTLEYVENRWRIPHPATPSNRPFQMAAVGAVSVMAIAGAQIVGVQLTERNIEASTGDLAAQSCFGAAALTNTRTCPVVPDADVIPAPVSAAADRATPFSDGCMARPPYANPRSCTFGTGSTQVALVGNSHAAHWLPALKDLAASHDLTITTFLVTACTTIDDPLDYAKPERVEGCERWRDATLTATAGDAFDLVLTSQRSVHPVQGYTLADTYQPWVDGMRRFLDSWSSTDTPVLIIRDTPLPANTMKSVPACVVQNLKDQTVCAGSRDEWITPDPLVDAAEGVPGIAVVDMNDHFCSKTTCQGVNGGVLTYFDGSHLTAAYARTLAPFLGPVIDEAIDRARLTVPVGSRLS